MPVLRPEGYSTIGSGSTYAAVALIMEGYRTDLNLTKTKEILIKAKKDSEKDRDVGNGVGCDPVAVFQEIRIEILRAVRKTVH